MKKKVEAALEVKVDPSREIVIVQEVGTEASHVQDLQTAVPDPQVSEKHPDQGPDLETAQGQQRGEEKLQGLALLSVVQDPRKRERGPPPGVKVEVQEDPCLDQRIIMRIEMTSESKKREETTERMMGIINNLTNALNEKRKIVHL